MIDKRKILAEAVEKVVEEVNSTNLYYLIYASHRALKGGDGITWDEVKQIIQDATGNNVDQEKLKEIFDKET